MEWQVLSSASKNLRVNLDPRTKLFLLITICILVIGGQINGIMLIIRPALAAISLILLFTAGKRKISNICIGVYVFFFICENFILPVMTGTLGFILLFFSGFITRLLPGMVMGYYTVETTSVSEFIAAMKKIHLTKKIVIPLAVMFRFFPTVIEEYHAIGDAMRMRGIRFGGKNIFKILEYRFIPMMICSIKIGEELSAAALTRGLGAPVHRTNICRIGFHFIDIFLIFLCIALFILSILSKIGVF
ncbi:energy-coupling factor transporter transmembrane protein EcfT [Clostridium sp. D2Q-14]|uniref:energy-coupling factor transporter transmembrane component T n=1 Tax=Anaeromonas gelatinilytica TaxID=2683194 RepID=UPI00193C093F|nr:energy-coupling factor transporter transmembrane protein EcfT [Anaeromonas gelatinilytica]